MALPNRQFFIRLGALEAFKAEFRPAWVRSTAKIIFRQFWDTYRRLTTIPLPQKVKRHAENSWQIPYFYYY